MIRSEEPKIQLRDWQYKGLVNSEIQLTDDGVRVG